MDGFQALRLGAGLGIALIVLAIASEAWLDHRSPARADRQSGKTLAIRQRDGNIYVTPVEFYLNRGAYGAGGALVAGSILGLLWMSRRR